MTKRLVNHFLRGLVFVAPVALTLYFCWLVFTTIDGWLPFRIPGAGFAITIAAITLVGFLASAYFARRILAGVEQLMRKVPLVRLLYSATRDLTNAFVGEQRRFDRPVVVELSGTGAKILGFVTQDELDWLGTPGHLAVYVPQSYNFAGNLLIVPRDQVRSIQAGSPEVMAFIVSGGVSRLPAAAAPAA